MIRSASRTPAFIIAIMTTSVMMLFSAPAPAFAVTMHSQPPAPPIPSSSSQAVSTELPSSLVAKAAPFVSVHGGHAVLTSAAKAHLTTADYSAVAASIRQFNATPSATSGSGVAPVAYSNPSTRPHASQSAPAVAPAGCAWSWNFTPHWYGWTFWMNDCAVHVFIGLLATGSGAAWVAAEMGGIPGVVAAALALAAGALLTQEAACNAMGYGGVGYGDFVGTYFFYC